MRNYLERFLSRRSGMLLCGIGLIATLALATTGKLTLYVHPRYVVFTVILTVAGAVLFALAVWFSAAPHEDHDHHGHDHTDHDGTEVGSPRRRRVSSVWHVTLVLIAAFGLLVAPPTTLSAERALSSITATDGGGDVPAPVLAGSDPTRFSIRDWATILGTGARADEFA